MGKGKESTPEDTVGGLEAHTEILEQGTQEKRNGQCMLKLPMLTHPVLALDDLGLVTHLHWMSFSSVGNRDCVTLW